VVQVHPLTDLVISGFANNEIRITRRSSPQRPKNWGDKTAHKRLEAESGRLNQIIELGQELRRYQGQTFIEVPLLPYRSQVGIIKPLELTKSPGGVDLGVYRRSDVESFRNLLIAEDSAIRAGNPPPLDITNEFQENLNQVKKPSARDLIETRFRDLALGFIKIRDRKKPEKLTRYGRHTILEAGQIIENECGLNAVFITTTIPGSTRAAIATVAANSPGLINKLTQMIRDFGKKTGIEIYWFFTWELQCRGALHPHIVIAAKPSEMAMDQLLGFGEKLKNHWYKMLLKLEKTTGVDVFQRATRYGVSTWRDRPDKWQSDVMPASKSVAAYISKYASKDAATKHQKALDTLAARGIEKSLPKRFWGCSRNIMKIVRSWRFKHTIPVAWLADPEIEKMLYSTLEGGYLELAQSDNKAPHNSCITKYNEVIERALGYRFAVVKNNRTIINGETEVYWYKPDVFAEIHGQIKAISEINYKAVPTQKSTSPKRVVGSSVLSAIADDNGIRRINAEIKIIGVDPGNGLIVDLEQFCWYQEWQNMQDSWWKNETFRMADEEVEWSAKVWSIWFDNLRNNLNRENEYDLMFGNQSPPKEIGEWEMIEALCASWEVEKEYREK
jgi:hypothetical protein